MQSTNPQKSGIIKKQEPERKEKKTARYSKEFKEEALRLSDEIGVKKAASQLGLPYYTLADWRNNRNHTAEAITEALNKVMSYFAEQKNRVFKTITGDNGSEFAGLSLLEASRLKVYFTHPYSSCEKGTNECHNRMLRRFIPKGKSISDYTADEICFFADCINGLPRKILGYATPEKLFDRQLDLIYAA